MYLDATGPLLLSHLAVLNSGRSATPPTRSTREQDRPHDPARHFALSPALAAGHPVGVSESRLVCACPRAVLEYQRELVDQTERDPIYFFNRQRQSLLDESCAKIASCVGADPGDLVFDTNATHGLNAVLRWTRFRPGDEILVTNHGYNAITNAARYVADQTGARVVTAEIPVPVQSNQQLVDAVLGALTANTRLAILDHITSPTAMIMPLAEILPVLRERSIVSLVDGARPRRDSAQPERTGSRLLCRQLSQVALQSSRSSLSVCTATLPSP